MKTVSGVINCHIGAVINYYDILHGLQVVRVTGIASLEANLLQHLVMMRDGVLYEVFMELQKSYYSLDR